MKKVFSYSKLGEMEIGDVVGRKIYMSDCFDSMSFNGKDVLDDVKKELIDLGIVEDGDSVYIKSGSKLINIVYNRYCSEEIFMVFEYKGNEIGYSVYLGDD